MNSWRCLGRSRCWRSGLRGRRWRRSRLGRLSLRSGCLRNLFLFLGSLLRGKIPEMFAHELGVAQINGARVRLFFLDADFREVIDQDLSLDFELPCQLVDANLIRI